MKQKLFYLGRPFKDYKHMVRSNPKMLSIVGSSLRSVTRVLVSRMRSGAFYLSIMAAPVDLELKKVNDNLQKV